MQTHVLSGVIYLPYSHWNRHRKRGICIRTGVHQSLIGLCFLSGVMNWEFVIRLQENRAAVRFCSGLEGSQNNLHTNIGIITYINTANSYFFFSSPTKNALGTLNSMTKSHKKTWKQVFCFILFCFFSCDKSVICKNQEERLVLSQSFDWLSWRRAIRTVVRCQNLTLWLCCVSCHLRVRGHQINREACVHTSIITQLSAGHERVHVFQPRCVYFHAPKKV